MSCEKILQRLSEFFDGVLDYETSLKVSQHLVRCENCRKEFEEISDLHSRLESLPSIQAPAYLRNFIQLRLAERQQPWISRVRGVLERYWSIIRTTEGMWYLTRALGTAMASIFFVLISSAVSPYYISVNSPVRISEYGQKVGINVLKNLGMLPPKSSEERSGRSKPAINPLYFVNFGQSVSEGQDDTLSVVTFVDQSGSAKIQNVLEYPLDETLLSSFNEMITSARCRPASKDGQAVPSHMVLMFSKVSVYD
jgi:hypothetical protein